MTAEAQISALIATFVDRHHAEHFIKELKRANFQDHEVEVLFPDGKTTEVEEDAMAGAISGGMVGAAAVAATGLIPGIGPVIAAGLLAGILGGAAAGAATGGLLGALIGLGIPEDEGRCRHERDYLEGRTLVGVQALGRGGEALAILYAVARPS